MCVYGAGFVHKFSSSHSGLHCGSRVLTREDCATGCLSLCLIREWDIVGDDALTQFDITSPTTSAARRRQRHKFTCNLASLKYGKILTVRAAARTIVVPIAAVLASVTRVRDALAGAPAGLSNEQEMFLLSRAVNHSLYSDCTLYASARTYGTQGAA